MYHPDTPRCSKHQTDLIMGECWSCEMDRELAFEEQVRNEPSEQQVINWNEAADYDNESDSHLEEQYENAQFEGADEW